MKMPSSFRSKITGENELVPETKKQTPVTPTTGRAGALQRRLAQSSASGESMPMKSMPDKSMPMKTMPMPKKNMPMKTQTDEDIINKRKNGQF